MRDVTRAGVPRQHYSPVGPLMGGPFELNEGAMEVAMRTPAINDYVRLACDLPELELSRGEIGVVRSKWCAPDIAYEVEFHTLGMAETTRALLSVDQIEADDDVSLGEPIVH